MNNELVIDAIWLSVSFLMGLFVKRFNLPSLVGFLIAGIILNLIQFGEGKILSVIDTLANLGILLLLFTIGLKVKLNTIIKKEIWITASSHLIISIIVIGGLIFSLSYILGNYIGNLSSTSSLLIGFALSFSSTVFVVKILEERGELNSYHGKIAIGILIIQDVFAVLFLTLSSGKLPSLFALLLPIYIYLIRYILAYLLKHVGHGELLTIFGFFATFVAGGLVFHLLDIKPDLGALIMGMILVNEKKADELYDRMMNYKDFFLIAFFTKVGLIGLPSWSSFIIALLLLVFIIFKGGLFMILFSRFKMRARTAFLASLSLSNYSEFALIIAFIGLQLGLLTQQWISILALVMMFSFFISSPFTSNAHAIFDKYRSYIMKFNTGKKYVDEEPKSIDDAEYVIIGYGSIGKPAYKHFKEKLEKKVVAIDYNHEIVKKYKNQGINIRWGDTSNSIFWENIDFKNVKIVIIAMSDFHSNLNSLNEIIRLKNRTFKIAAVCSYLDEAKILKEKHVDYVYDYKIYLGNDFAEQTYEKYKHENT